jgi:hypothetical protein
MKAVTLYLDNPKSRWRKFRLWLAVVGWPEVRDFFLRYVYAHHNAGSSGTSRTAWSASSTKRRAA